MLLVVVQQKCIDKVEPCEKGCRSRKEVLIPKLLCFVMEMEGFSPANDAWSAWYYYMKCHCH